MEFNKPMCRISLSELVTAQFGARAGNLSHRIREIYDISAKVDGYSRGRD